MKEGDIMEKYNKERLARASEAVRKAGLSQIIVSDAAALWYLTEEEIHPGERLTVLVIPSDSDPYWVRNRLFPLKRSGIADHPFEDGEDGIGLLASLLADGRTGVDGVWHSAFLLDLMGRGGNRTFVNGSPLIDALRAVKDEEEIRRMKAASLINDRAVRRIRDFLYPGVTEKECAEELRKIYKEEGAEGFSFPPIVSFGAHGADPHHSPDDTKLAPGDSVLFDIGCKKDHYCSDMTRTYFTGEPTEEEKKVHDTVREAGLRAEALIRPGVLLKDIDKAARDCIAEAGYGLYFTHRLGHFIGIREHEAGEVSPNSPLAAKPGMIFSIEPGIYLPGRFGVRIENLVLVTEDGCELLNHEDRGWKAGLRHGK